MTEINKEIEEMAEVIGRAIIDKISIDFGEKCQDCDFANENNIELSIDSQEIATALHKAGYRKQLENSVQLPCKVGDTLYFLREAKYKNPYNLNIETCKVEKLILTEKGWRIKLDANSMYETSIKALGTTLFTTKEAAEARLAELEGKSNGGN